MAAAVRMRAWGNQEIGDASGSLAGRRVLVVEDDWLLAQEVVGLLQRAGVVVLGPAPRIEDALRIIAAGDLDAALLNINLSGEMSYPIADALAARQVRFAFLTGYTAEVVPARFSATPLYEKPADPRLALLKLFAPPVGLAGPASGG
ncbi:response regulator [Phenylobacterium sp. LjRoot97]